MIEKRCIFDRVFSFEESPDISCVSSSIEYHEFICTRTKRERKREKRKRGEPLSESDLSAGAYDHPHGGQGELL